MGDYLRISGNSLEKDVQRIDELIATLPALIDDLQQAMQKLSSCWEGPAWAAYQQTVTSDVEKLTDMYEHMGKYTIYMKEAAKEYTRAEQDVCADINRVSVW